MKARSNLMDMASTAGMSPEVPVTQPRAKPVAARRKRPVKELQIANKRMKEVYRD